MTEKEKAEELVKKHLTAIAEESMDSDKMMRIVQYSVLLFR